MSPRALRTAAAVLVFASPACVVRLSDRNAPLPNGGVSGAPADCRVVQPAPEGAPGGAAATSFVGRFDLTDPTRPRFDWSGNAMSARFVGTEVTWGVESGVEQVFQVILDGVAQKVILPDYTIPTAAVVVRTQTVPQGTHEITVVRSSEALFGDTTFIPFTFGGDTTQLPPVRYERRIEYIGDSITCGYGDEGPNATCPYDVPIRQARNDRGEVVDVKIPETQNIFLAYGSLAARRLSAQATTLCFSGKGVALNYREQGVGEGKLDPSAKPDADAKTTIPEYYLRTLATEKPDATKPQSAWDFASEPQPQVVVINVGTNDFARDVDQNGIADGIDLGAFRQKYREFLAFVRAKRPAAKIFLAVPPMVTDKFPLDNARSDFRSTLRGIVDEVNGAGDRDVFFLELVEMGVRYGLGCDYHPNLEVHRIMADQLVGAIRDKTCWTTVDP
jgi:lysophospholipase L1-like esterase